MIRYRKSIGKRLTLYVSKARGEFAAQLFVHSGYLRCHRSVDRFQKEAVTRKLVGDDGQADKVLLCCGAMPLLSCLW